jgi:hypothetical protein
MSSQRVRISAKSKFATFAPYARAREITKLVDIHRCLYTGDEQEQPAHGVGTVWSSRRGRLGKTTFRTFAAETSRTEPAPHPRAREPWQIRATLSFIPTS